MLGLAGLILKSPKRALVRLKNSSKYFQNSPMFNRSACFYVTITGKFESFEYFYFETNFPKNNTKLPFQKPMLRQ